MFGRYLRLSVVLLSWVPIATAKGQDSPRLAHALDQAAPVVATHMLRDSK